MIASRGGRLSPREMRRVATRDTLDQVIPDDVRWLFWEVDPDTIDLERHRDYVLERVMARGDWTAMRWLIRTVPAAQLAEFLVRKGKRLAPRERAFWSLIAGCPRVSEVGGARPIWAGP